MILIGIPEGMDGFCSIKASGIGYKWAFLSVSLFS